MVVENSQWVRSGSVCSAILQYRRFKADGGARACHRQVERPRCIIPTSQRQSAIAIISPSTPALPIW
jgi:hypothetical protein